MRNRNRKLETRALGTVEISAADSLDRANLSEMNFPETKRRRSVGAQCDDLAVVRKKVHKLHPASVLPVLYGRQCGSFSVQASLSAKVVARAL